MISSMPERGKLFDDHLERRGIDDGQEFLGDDFGGGQHTGAHPSGDDHGLGDFHDLILQIRWVGC